MGLSLAETLLCFLLLSNPAIAADACQERHRFCTPDNVSSSKQFNGANMTDCCAQCALLDGCISWSWKNLSTPSQQQYECRFHPVALAIPPPPPPSPPTPAPLWEVKVGRGGCKPNGTIFSSGGFASEQQVEAKCTEVSCGFWVYSTDPKDSPGSAWLCKEDQFETVDNADQYPLWKVGHHPSPYDPNRCFSGNMRTAAPTPAPAPAPKAAKNVLLLIVDDLRPEAAIFNESFMITPNIDRLGRMGTVFSHAYCQQAICGPTRNSFLSGRRPQRTKSWNFRDDFRMYGPDWVSLPQYFKQHSYTTLGTG